MTVKQILDETSQEVKDKVKEYTKYILKQKKGIDDLKSLYAFHGNSQGDESASNDIERYKDSKGWMSFTFDCDLTKEAIAEEVLKRDEWNKAYIADLKEKGEYGQEFELTIAVQPNPLFDRENTYPKSQPLTSYEMVFIDFKTEKDATSDSNN